ncbi:MAG: hypothetical protein HFJ06_13580 [Lachnospiraceae bacterium]|nr:hypothetical protein [Lachnospiraceae bacterium]
MGLFTKKIGTVFLKETSDTGIFIEKLQVLMESAPEGIKKEIETQIKFASYGEIGENNVAFELKNSGIDMYVLRDIYLEIGDLSAQIDYIVITRKHIYVLECKNLIGNIEIDNRGNFIRNYELSGKRVREKMYSPITQNQRHLLVLKEVRKSNKGNFLTKLIFEKSFEDNYKSVVVLANPKTCLNDRFAKKEIKQQVIHADQLITYIKDLDNLKKDSNMSVEEMRELAQFYLDHSQPNKSDYVKKYEEMMQAVENLERLDCIKDTKETVDLISEENTIRGNISDTTDRKELEKCLKDFRKEQSQKENVRPYFIFNNAQMNDLIDQKPRNKKELLKVSGFGKIKVEKYGDAIIEILNNK